MNIILFGSPGAGKGTQSEKLVKKYGLTHISTGDLLREEKKKGTELSKQLNLGSGFLVPDEVVLTLIKTFIDEHKDSAGFLFDGFPRTIEQAIELNKIIKIDKAILLMVNDDKVIARIVERGKKSEREDDTKETAVIRLKEYSTKTYPIKQYYSLNGILSVINGELTPDEVFNNLCKLL